MSDEIEVTQSIEPKFSGEISLNETTKKYSLSIKVCEGEWNEEQLSNLKVFAGNLICDTPEEIVTTLTEYCENNSLQLSTREKAVRGTKIQEIWSHFKDGKTVDEVIALGFNSGTVKIQHSKYKKTLQ